jgi:hypothetical protein
MSGEQRPESHKHVRHIGSVGFVSIRNCQLRTLFNSGLFENNGNRQLQNIVLKND